MEKSTVNEACCAYVHPRSDLHKYVYYRRRVLMLHYELESCTVFAVFCPLEFGNTKAHAWFCNYSYIQEHTS